MIQKTALRIDPDLCRRTAEILGTTGATATIDAAFREIVARAARERLRERLRSLGPEDREAILRSWD